MPLAPLRPCRAPGCPELVRSSACPAHAAPEEPRASSNERGYTKAWSRARTAYLGEHPLCASCLAAGRVVSARVVDHVVPHRGDMGLFWDRANWQPLCDWTSSWNCHGRKTANEANALKGRGG